MREVADMRATIELVHAESTRLGDFLAGLAPEQWDTDSACAEWKVGDVVAHLAQAGNTWAEGVRRAKQGDYSPPPGQRALQPGERGSETTAQRAIEMRQATGPAALLESYVDGYQKLDQQLQELKPEDWEKPCFHRRGVMPVNEYVVRRIQELSIHGWDVRSSFDPNYQLASDAARLLVSVTHRWLNTTFAPLEDAPGPARFRFEVTDPVSLREDVVIQSGGFEIQPVNDATPDVTFRSNASSYILLVFGRIKPGGGNATGQLGVEGDPGLAARFGQWFQGV